MANCVIYRDLLAKQGHGLPFWQPEPDANLDNEYTKQGISIGDLGVLTEDGGFDFLFNIHANVLAPVNRNVTPLSFLPLPPVDRTNIRKITDFHPKDACMTHNADYSLEGTFRAGAEVVPDAGLNFEVGFTITQTKAAMLVLPDGAGRHEAKAYGEYQNYAIKHGKSWYEYFNGVERRQVRNGSLYLVTGCDKARSWGLAAGSPHQARELTFSIAALPVVLPVSEAVSLSASWRNVTGVGSHYPSSTRAITEDKNKCVARGFVIGINEDFFQKQIWGIVNTKQIGFSPEKRIEKDVPFQPPRANASSATAPPTSQHAANQYSRGNLLDQEQDTIASDDSDTTSSVIVRDYPEYPKLVSLLPKAYQLLKVVSGIESWFLYL